MVFYHFDDIRSYCAPRIPAICEYDRNIMIRYGTPRVSLDRSLYYEAPDGTTDSRDARDQYWYRTRSWDFTCWASIWCYLVTGLVGYIPKLEEIV